MSAAPIGIFDSGLGGLSILREVRRVCPRESLLYIADSHYAPYGDRPAWFVEARTLQVCEWLAAQGCKMLVVACNTATAHAVGRLRQQLPLPVIGVEPGLKPAAASSRSKVVGVLATSNTLRSDKFAALLASLEGAARFVCAAGVGLVPLIEQGDIAGPSVREKLHAYLSPMLDAGADTLVLGCTHYPFLSDTIREMAGDRLALIDTGVAVARQVERKLAEHQIAAPRCDAPLARYVTTGDAAHLRDMAATLLRVDAQTETVAIEPAPTAPDLPARVQATVQATAQATAQASAQATHWPPGNSG